jgi:hypothetical protein
MIGSTKRQCERALCVHRALRLPMAAGLVELLDGAPVLRAELALAGPVLSSADRTGGAASLI